MEAFRSSCRSQVFAISCRKMEHGFLTVIGHRSWLDGFCPGNIDGCVVALCVLENNNVVLLKYQPQ